MAKERHHAIHMTGFRNDVNVVSFLGLIITTWNEGPSVPNDGRNHHGRTAHRGEVLHLASEQRAPTCVAVNSKKAHPTISEGYRVESARGLEAAGYAVGHFDFGRDNHVDGQLIGGVEPSPDRLQI